MISVQHLLRVLHVVVILRINSPRQIQQRVQIVQLSGVVRRESMHVLEAFELFLKLLSNRYRPYFLFGALTQFLDRLFVVIAKVFLDGLHLLLQEILALLLVDFLSRSTTDIGLDGQFLQVSLQDSKQRLGTFCQRMDLQ